MSLYYSTDFEQQSLYKHMSLIMKQLQHFINTLCLYAF